jgi:hypothetical protein
MSKKLKKKDPLPTCVPQKPLIKQKKAAIVGRNQLDSRKMLRNKLTYCTGNIKRRERCP